MLSIVIPVYNGSRFVKETIRSVLAQSYDDIEIIVCDDGSSDNSRSIVESMAATDVRIKPIFRSENLGMCKNVNDSVRYCKGEFLLILGQDDILPPYHCKEMLKCFSSSDVVAVFCEHDLIDTNMNRFLCENQCLHRDLRPVDFISNNPVPSCGLIMRMSAFQQVDGFEESDEFPNYGEYDLWIKLLGIGEIKFCGMTRALYRRHDANISNSFQKLETRLTVEKYLNESRKKLFYIHGMRTCDYLYLSAMVFMKSLRRIIWMIEKRFL